MITLLLLWAAYVLTALLWTGAVVAVLGAFTLAIGLCRACSLDDGAVATDLEIDEC